jgi:hypothetical protein
VLDIKSAENHSDMSSIMKKYFIDWHLVLHKQDISLCNEAVGIHFALCETGIS